jgi:hypothetical protein
MASTPTADGDSRLSSKVIRPLAELERDAILEAVDCCGAERAAKLLGIGTTTLYRKLLLYSATALASQSHDARTVLVIPLDRVRVLLHEADRAAKMLLRCQEETASLLAQSLSKQIESFCQQFPQLKTWKK